MPPRPFIPVHGAMRTTIFAHHPTLMSPAEMTFGSAVRSGADPSSSDCAYITAATLNWIASPFNGLVADGVVFDHVETKSLASDPGPFDDEPSGVVAAGGAGTNATIAALVLLHTGETGRSHNGRSYSLFPPDSAMVGAAFTTAYRSSLLAAFVTLQTSVAFTGLYLMAVISEKNLSLAGVLNFTMNLKLSYQTRRDPNRG
jgi:hypothetical protein